MKSVTLVSGHYLGSRRRAGFHALARAYHQLGWDVLFVTAPISHLSRVRRDHRFQYPVWRERNRFVTFEPRLTSFVFFTAFHPVNLRSRMLNGFARPIMSTYGSAMPRELSERVSTSDLIIFESSPAILLVANFKRLARRARFVYRVSDDLRVLGSPPLVIDAEREIAHEFDLVSVPTAAMLDLFDGLASVHVLHHGIDKALFDQVTESPYDDRYQHKAIFVGTSRFDYEFLECATTGSSSIAFHIIGPIKPTFKHPSVVYHGELPFTATVPFIQHASIGLHTLQYDLGAESFRDSLKVRQYLYCRLPIVAPNFMHSADSQFCEYVPRDASSIQSALMCALAFDRGQIDASGVLSWIEVAMQLAGESP